MLAIYTQQRLAMADRAATRFRATAQSDVAQT